MSDLIKIRKEKSLFMNRVFSSLKSGTAIALCLSIVVEPTSRVWASGNGQEMPGLEKEGNKIPVQKKNNSKDAQELLLALEEENLRRANAIDADIQKDNSDISIKGTKKENTEKEKEKSPPSTKIHNLDEHDYSEDDINNCIKGFFKNHVEPEYPYLDDNYTYLLYHKGRSENSHLIHDEGDGRNYIVAVIPPTQTLAPDNTRNAASHSVVHYLGDFEEDVLSECYRKILAGLPNNSNSELSEVEEILSKETEFHKLSTPQELLDECKNKSGLSNKEKVELFLKEANKKIKEKSASCKEKDVFNDFKTLIRNQTNSDWNLKILFPYNPTRNHWITGEIKIHKSGTTVKVQVFGHNPNGGVSEGNPFNEMGEEFNKLKVVMEHKIKALFPQTTDCTFETLSSPYTKYRQHDDISCGPICVDELTKRVIGKALEMDYEKGTLELRRTQRDFLKENKTEHEFLESEDPAQDKMQALEFQRVLEVSWPTQTHCLWHLDTSVYQLTAQSILERKAIAGDKRAFLKYLKKLESPESIEFFLKATKEKLLLSHLLIKTLKVTDDKRKKNLYSSLNKLYETLLPSLDGPTLEDKFRVLQAKYYYEKLLEPNDSKKEPLLQEINRGLEELYGEEASKILDLKRAHLTYLVGEGDKLDLYKSQDAIKFAKALSEFAKKAETKILLSKLQEEQNELRKFAATLYRKAAYSFNLSASKAGNEKTFTLQLEHFLNAERLGDPIASYQLGLIYSNQDTSYYHPQNAKEAFKEAADNQYVLAEHKMASTVNQRQSQQYLERAAKQGHPDAMFKLYQYLKKEGESKEKALFYLWNAAELGHPKAQRNLAHLYWRGQEVKQNYTVALHWYETAALQNDRGAHFYLGLAAEKGLGKKQDFAEMCKEYALAEESGEKANVQLRRGRIYEKGKGVVVNLDIAFGHYKKAAKTGNAKAAYYAGRLSFKRGEDEGETYALLTQAANASLPKAFYLLGALHQLGIGVKPSYKLAKEFYNKEAEEAERKRLAELAVVEKKRLEEEAKKEAAEEAERKRLAELVLAEKKRLEEEAKKKAAEEAEKKRLAELALAEKKRLEEEAKKKAAEEAEKKRLAELGLAEKKRREEEAKKKAVEEAEKKRLAELALAEKKRREEEAKKKVANEAALLGLNYFRGINGMPEDNEKALEYLRKAENNGNKEGEMFYALGWLYCNGKGGVQVDYAKANAYFLNGIGAGHRGCYKSLGSSYLFGREVAENKQKARELFEEAEAKGLKDKWMFERLEEMYRNGTGGIKDSQKADNYRAQINKMG